jgi:hypothetical protein
VNSGRRIHSCEHECPGGFTISVQVTFADDMNNGAPISRPACTAKAIARPGRGLHVVTEVGGGTDDPGWF